jgi:hypothetical protein
MSKHVLVVFTNAVEGQDEEFNDWYDRVHIPDLLNIPEIKSAQRFRLSGAQKMPPPYAWRYMALYEIETDDLSKVISIIKERAGTPLMPLTDTLQPERIGWYFDTISSPVAASALQHSSR